MDDVHRDTLIAKLLKLGWQSCEDSQDWDLQKDGNRVLLATEKGDLGSKRTLVRVEGEASAVRAILSAD